MERKGAAQGDFANCEEIDPAAVANERETHE
jgi:hypothetical protein